MKLLTVSIAAYNAEAYLSKALQSLIQSKYLEQLEIIVVNDGSKDKTAEIAKRYADKYPDSVLLINKKNAGYGSTINSSLKIATGKYFKLLDADDWYETTELDKLMEYLQAAIADIVFTNYFEYYEQNLSYFKRQPLECSAETVYPIECLKKCNLNPAMTIKTEILKPDLKITEKCFYTDYEFCTKAVLQAENFVYCPFFVYVYRIGREGQSISIEGKTKNIFDHDYIMRLTAEMILKSPKHSALYEETHKTLKGHITNYFSYVKPTLSNLKAFEDYCSYVKRIAPEVEKYLNNIEKKMFLTPRLWFLPVCFYNRLIYNAVQLKKRWRKK